MKHELELMKKRLFIAKAERVDVAQLELEFATRLAELDALSKRLDLPDAALEGKVPRSGFEVSSKLRWRRGSMVRVKTMRVKYRDEVEGLVSPKTYTAEMPPERA